MNPYLMSVLVEARLEELRQEAARHRLVAQARAASARPGGGTWRNAVRQVAARAQLLTPPTQATARAPQPSCCPA